MLKLLLLLLVTGSCANTWTRTTFDASNRGFVLDPVTHLSYVPHLFSSNVDLADCQAQCIGVTECRYIKWWFFNGSGRCTGFATWEGTSPSSTSSATTGGNLYVLNRS
eukprot:TRINITY_DN7271_c0_g1_i1.p1 TRINITY_DN7271_c0_g1~~TRINITY_DN7271_c0_g1_i1.p1  ORF type:complete len:108 (+),score=13.37 TRINITY_DN7271_c0_g1_i1:54-377(+)